MTYAASHSISNKVKVAEIVVSVEKHNSYPPDQTEGHLGRKQDCEMQPTDWI